MHARSSRSPGQPSRPCRAGRLDRRHLQPRLHARAGELRPRRRVEGRARGGRPLPRRGARASRTSASTPFRPGSSRPTRSALPQQGADAARGTPAHARGAHGRAGRRRRRRRIPLLARTPRWCGARRSCSTAATRSSSDGADRAQPPRLGRGAPAQGGSTRRRARNPAARPGAAAGASTGKHVLHLQCATGESTAELAALGAFVTAVDASDEALAVARDADARGRLGPRRRAQPAARAPPRALPPRLHRRRRPLPAGRPRSLGRGDRGGTAPGRVPAAPRRASRPAVPRRRPALARGLLRRTPARRRRPRTSSWPGTRRRRSSTGAAGASVRSSARSRRPSSSYGGWRSSRRCTPRGGRTPASPARSFSWRGGSVRPPAREQAADGV